MVRRENLRPGLASGLRMKQAPPTLPRPTAAPPSPSWSSWWRMPRRVAGHEALAAASLAWRVRLPALRPRVSRRPARARELGDDRLCRDLWRLASVRGLALGRDGKAGGAVTARELAATAALACSFCGAPRGVPCPAFNGKRKLIGSLAHPHVARRRAFRAHEKARRKAVAAAEHRRWLERLANGAMGFPAARVEKLACAEEGLPR